MALESSEEGRQSANGQWECMMPRASIPEIEGGLESG